MVITQVVHLFGLTVPLLSTGPSLANSIAARQLPRCTEAAGIWTTSNHHSGISVVHGHVISLIGRFKGDGLDSNRMRLLLKVRMGWSVRSINPDAAIRVCWANRRKAQGIPRMRGTLQRTATYPTINMALHTCVLSSSKVVALHLWNRFFRRSTSKAFPDFTLSHHPRRPSALVV